METFAGALFGLVLILGFLFNVRFLVQEPSPGTIFFTVIVLTPPALFLVMLWLESSSPDPFGPVPEKTMKAYADLIERLDTWGFRLEAAAVQRGHLGMASLVFVNRSDQIIALVAGNNPKKALLWLYSQIGGHQVVLSTANHGSGTRAPGELRQWLPRKQLPDLIETHKEAAAYLRSQGFTVGVEIDEDSLDFLRFLSEIERQNRKRSGRYLLGLAFGDLLVPRTKPLAKQRNIKRRLAQLPTR